MRRARVSGLRSQRFPDGRRLLARASREACHARRGRRPPAMLKVIGSSLGSFVRVLVRHRSRKNASIVAAEDLLGFGLRESSSEQGAAEGSQLHVAGEYRRGNEAKHVRSQRDVVDTHDIGHASEASACSSLFVMSLQESGTVVSPRLKKSLIWERRPVCRPDCDRSFHDLGNICSQPMAHAVGIRAFFRSVRAVPSPFASSPTFASWRRSHRCYSSTQDINRDSSHRQSVA